VGIFPVFYFTSFSLVFASVLQTYYFVAQFFHEEHRIYGD